jgi:hypothetical protein
MIHKLLKIRLRILLNLLKDSRKARITVFITLGLAVFAIIIANFLSRILKIAVSSPEIGDRLVENIASLSMHGIFLLMCFYGLSYAVYSIFFGKDLELLFSLPVKRKDIFLFKIIEAVFFNTRISVLFAMPALIVMGIYYHSGFHYYLFALLLLVILTAIPGSLGILAASLITRKVSRSKLRNALAISGAVMGLAVWGVFNFLSRSLGENLSEGADAAGLIFRGLSPALSFFPSGWASMAAIDIAKGEFAGFLFYFVLITAFAILVTLIAYKSMSWYFKGGIVEEFSGPSRTRLLSFSGGGSPFIAHLRRDIIIILREINALSQSLILIAFLTILPFFAGSAGDRAAFPLSIPPTGLIFAIILGCQIGSRLIPLERRAFWHNIISPFGSRYAILSKSVIGIIIGLLVAVTVGIIHQLGGIVAGADYILMLAGFQWAGFGSGMVFSIYFSDFGWENPNRMMKMGGLLLYLFSLFALAIPMGVAAYISGEMVPGIIDPGLLVMALGLGLLLISILITRNKMSNYQWETEV